jgi:DNA-binding helix-hairpin-helix protein with protein kinase domain
MMIEKGRIVKSDSGRRIRIEKPVMKKTWDDLQAKWIETPAMGGQACVYWATEMNTSQKGVAKIFKKEFANADTVKRSRFLVEQCLGVVCPILLAPVEVLNQGDLVGHFTPFAEGKSLENHLREPDWTFSEQIQLAIALSHAIEVMHARNIAHGDIQSENFIIQRTGNVLRPCVIDLDNFNARGMPAPPCVGHNLYMAPELRRALAKRQRALPTVATDLYSLAVLLHEILLLIHPSAGNDGDELHFQEAMCSGKWLLDPTAAGPPSGSLGGYPATILNTDLARLFRSAMSLDPANRPSANSWEAELSAAFHAVGACPNPACGGLFVSDVSKSVCPLCGRPFPHLTLRRTGRGRAVPLVQGSTIIGRTELGNSPMVSARHAIFRRVGPETMVESIGRNGTCRWNGSKWARLPDGKPLPIQAGDRLLLGDVEVLLN